jgi:hypothetical protein
MMALSREAGRYVLSEPELRAYLADLADAGRLCCAVCGEAIDREAVALVRRRLPHRWATLPAHGACARRLPPEPLALPAPAAVVAAAPCAAPAARIGRLAGRLALPTASLSCLDEAAVYALLVALGLGDAVPLGDFEPDVGPGVRALHAAFPDLSVFFVPELRLAVEARADGAWRLEVDTGRGALQADGSGGIAPFAAALAAGLAAVVLLACPRGRDGGEEPVAALLGQAQPHAARAAGDPGEGA